MLKFNSPLPQPLPKECQKAAKIFSGFVDSANHGLDGIIPRHVLENARGFAIFTVFKAGFVVSARGGTGIVIARLEDGSWSAPSAIGTAGMGFGGQLGAEVTDFLLVLNSRSAVKQFMSAGSLTFGGNMTIALGPLGRNGEVTGALNTNGKLAAMYCYSKSKGLFGGLSLEGSAIVERQDANALAYDADVTVKMLLSGAIPPPPWADVLISTLDRCTGLPGGRKWVETPGGTPDPWNEYAFSGVGSPGSKLRKKDKGSPSPGWGAGKRDSYFGDDDFTSSSPPSSPGWDREQSSRFSTPSPRESRPSPQKRLSGLFSRSRSNSNRFSISLGRSGTTSTGSPTSYNYDTSERFKTRQDEGSSFGRDYLDDLEPLDGPLNPRGPSLLQRRTSNPFAKQQSTSLIDDDPIEPAAPTKPFLTPRAGLAEPLAPNELGRAIARHDFDAVEDDDLSFTKGDIIYIIRKTDRTNDWWKGRIGLRTGNFPANYVELL